MAKIPLLFIFFLLFSSGVYAIGISPPDNTIDFQPNLTQTFKILVINNAGREISARIFSEGDLSEYVILPEDKILKLATNGRAYFDYTLKLPEHIEKPGIHDVRIGVVEMASESEGISAVSAVTSRLRILVPYPGKYLEVTFYAESAEFGKPVNFKITASSRSTEIINKATISVDIDNAGEKIATVKMPDIENLAPLETAERTAKWDTRGYKVGEYKAVARIVYDGNEIKKEYLFTVGTINIAILNHTTEFEGGKINKFDIQVQSQWNYVIPNVYVQIFIMDGETIISSSTTSTFSLPPWQTQTITAYLDIKGDIKPGEYDAKIIINYMNKTTEKNAKVTLNAKQKSGFGLNMTLVIIAALTIVVLFTFLNIFIFHRKKENVK